VLCTGRYGYQPTVHTVHTQTTDTTGVVTVANSSGIQVEVTSGSHLRNRKPIVLVKFSTVLYQAKVQYKYKYSSLQHRTVESGSVSRGVPPNSPSVSKVERNVEYCTSGTVL
jgi:hypothetical protein